jgi:hypothetical protein
VTERHQFDSGTVGITEMLEDRRRTERVPVSLPFRVSYADGDAGKIEEAGATLNVSFEGLYFSTQNRSYTVGMFLVVTFPYSHHSEHRANFFGKVARIDSLGNGLVGIAVKLVAVTPVSS